jgi:hypothetical protein
MNELNHETARRLLARAVIEKLTPGERNGLDRHLASCSECSSEASALAHTVGSLRSFSVLASPDLVRQTRRAVSSRAHQLHNARALSLPLWIATAVSSVLMILTAPYVWRTFAWFGRAGNMPEPVWQVFFLMWWFLPATVLAAAATWRHIAKDSVRNWIAESHWG